MNVWGVIGFVLLASVKYLVAPPVGFASGLGFWGTVIGMFAGGMLGMIVFYSLASFLINRSRLKRIRLNKEREQNNLPPLPNFTKSSKRIVRVKKKLGLYGVVFIALPFVSIPIEGILCAKFYRHEKRLFPLVVISVAAWSILLTAFYNLFYDDLVSLF